MLNLNLAIVSHCLSRRIRQQSIKAPFAFSLQKVRVYDGRTAEPANLYIARPEQLNQLKESSVAAVIFNGEIDVGEPEPGFEYVSVEETELLKLYAMVSDIFTYFRGIEIRLLQCFSERKDINEFGKILFELFENPVSIATSTLRVVMYVYEKRFLKKSQHYYILPSDSYLPDDEYAIIITDPEYRETLTTKLPSIFSKNMYGYRKLYQNIFHEKEYLGRLVVDEVFRPCREGDLAVMQWVAGYVKKAYFELCPVGVVRSKEIDDAVRSITVMGASYKEEYDKCFETYGWNADTNMIFIVFSRKADSEIHFSENENTIYLMKLFPGSYAFVHRGKILLLVPCLSNNQNRLYTLIRHFAEKNSYMAGCSNVYNNMRNTDVHYRQALAAMETGSAVDLGRNLYLYEDYLLQNIMKILREHQPPEFYISSKLRMLAEYDEGHGTELLHTLRVSLECDRRPVAAQGLLHVHRTTYLYRMRRIAELTGWELDDFRTRLYLSVALELLKE